jgi:hypothetical protein
MTEEKDTSSPKKISRKEANRLNNFAQELDDEITHVVDYGTMDDQEDNTKD